MKKIERINTMNASWSAFEWMIVGKFNEIITLLDNYFTIADRKVADNALPTSAKRECINCKKPQEHWMVCEECQKTAQISNVSTEHVSLNKVSDSTCSSKELSDEKKIEVQHKGNGMGCMTANGKLICYCGECKPEDYALPKDLPQPVSTVEGWEEKLDNKFVNLGNEDEGLTILTKDEVEMMLKPFICDLIAQVQKESYLDGEAHGLKGMVRFTDEKIAEERARVRKLLRSKAETSDKGMVVSTVDIDEVLLQELK